MKTSRLLLCVSAAASIAFVFARLLTTAGWPVILEVFSILLLALLGSRISRLLGGALAISALGDLLLGLQRIGNLNRETLFLFGLSAFLFAHLLYIALFRKLWTATWWKPGKARLLGIVLILAVLGTLLGILWPTLGQLRIPILIYALVLSGMGISAMLADLGTPLASIGALLFITSDAMIAISKFRGPFAGHDQLIWITYYLAQLLIFLGIRHGQRAQKNAAGSTSAPHLEV
jgi:uncharacterized membrane protein YhhN